LRESKCFYRGICFARFEVRIAPVRRAWIGGDHKEGTTMRKVFLSIALAVASLAAVAVTPDKSHSGLPLLFCRRQITISILDERVGK
jgi:hypothetical protein